MADPIDEKFEEIWRQRQAAREASSAEEPDGSCIYHRQFKVWAQQLCEKALQNRSDRSINQAMFLVFLKYMEWRVKVPKSHRDRIGERGHKCIFHVLESTYYQLTAAGLDQTRFDLFEPPAQVHPVYVTKNYVYSGFPIGESTVGEDDEEIE